MARLKDNVYVVLCSILGEMQARLRVALESPLQVIYGIAFKWEEHGMQVNWCESMLTRCEGRWALFRKGVCLSLPMSAQEHQDDYEWAKWTPITSPNVPASTPYIPTVTGTEVHVEC